MGNSSKKPEKTTKEHNHLRLRNAKEHIIKNKSNIKANFPVSSKEDYAAWEKSLKKPPAATARHAFIPNDLKSKSGMCGSSATAEAQYPGFWFLLSDEIKNRKKSGYNVDEKQIWQIIYALAETAKQYHKSNIKTGDIRPANILLDEDGDIKLVTQDSWPEQETNYVKTLRNGEKTYLAPEEMKDIDLGRNKQGTNIEDGDAFSLGLTALDCALLEESYSMYPKKGEIDLQMLEEKRNRLRNSEFSPQLKAAILSMTDPNPDNRSVPGQIYDWLKINQIEIYNMHPFTPSYSSPHGVSMFLDKSKKQQPNVNYSRVNSQLPQQNSQFPQQITQSIESRISKPVQNLSQVNSRMVYTQQTPINSYQPPRQSAQYQPMPQMNYTNIYSPDQRRSDIPDYIFKNKPAPIIRQRYLSPEESNYSRPPVSSQFYGNSRPNLRDVYKSPQIMARHTPQQPYYIPKSQQKDIIKRPTYDFGNTINYQQNFRSSSGSNNASDPQSSNFQHEPTSLVDHLKSKVNYNSHQEEDTDYRPKTQTVIVNRGSKPQALTVGVEEDIELPKMSNWEIDRHRNKQVLEQPRQTSKTPPPEVEEDLPYKPKMSYWNTDNTSPSRRSNFQISNSNIPVIHQASEEDSRLRSAGGRETPPKSNMQPIQSAYQSEEEAYKISFFNSNRRLLPNQYGEDGLPKANASREPTAISGYQPSPVVQSSQGPRKMVMKKKKQVMGEDEDEIHGKMNAERIRGYQYH